VIFALELTHDVNVLLPLLLAVTMAHGFTVLALRRSILTEKVSRRGYHLSREYAIDPLEIIFAREVARTGVVVLQADATPPDIRPLLRPGPAEARRQQRLFPVVDDQQGLVGVVTRQHLTEWADRGAPDAPLSSIAHKSPVVAHSDEPLRVIAFRMAETGVTRVPIVHRGSGVFAGMIALSDLLSARGRILEAEQRRERVLVMPFGSRAGRGSAA
jgi:CBS domain-containing protein